MPGSITTSDDLPIPEVLAEAVQGAFSGMTALSGSEAAVVNLSLPSTKGGDKMKVPYFGTIGEMEDVGTEGDALGTTSLSSTVEESVVQHSGKGVSVTDWALLAASFSDPYAEIARQIRESADRRIDKGLVDAAQAAGLPAAQDLDVFVPAGGGAARTLDWDLIVDGRMSFGDENDGVALMVIHSKVQGDLLKLKDSTGKPLLIDMNNDGQVMRVNGIRVKVSDRLTVDTTDARSKYTTLLLQKGAIIAWVNGKPVVLPDVNAAANTRSVYTHVYHVEHRYKRLRGMSRGGVTRLRHN